VDKKRTKKDRKTNKIRKALIVRGRALGDLIWCTEIPEFLANDGYKVDFLAFKSNAQILQNNPHLNIINLHEGMPDTKQAYDEILKKYEGFYDLIVNLLFSVEGRFLWRTDMNYGVIPSEEQRRQIPRNKNYFIETVKIAGYLSRGYGKIYFSKEEEDKIKKWKESLKGYKVILWQPEGSTMNKRLPKVFKWIKAVLDYVPKSYHIVVSNTITNEALKGYIDDERVLTTCGSWNIRTIIGATKYADLVVGATSFLVNVASCFETPNVVIFSAEEKENLTEYWKNSYFIYPKCKCFPCYLIPVYPEIVSDPEKKAIAQKYHNSCMGVYNYKCMESVDTEEVLSAIFRALGVIII